MKNKQIDVGLLLLRVGFSAMMLTHGIPKLSLLTAEPFKFSDPLGIGMLASLILALVGEVLAPVLIIIGYKVRYAVIPVIMTMVVALFFVHLKDAFGVQEKAWLYLVAFLCLAITGGGNYVLKK